MLFVPAVSCPKCSYPNDKDFIFCQHCVYRRQTQAINSTQNLKAAVNWHEIQKRWQDFVQKASGTRYGKQKTALEKELSVFLAENDPPKDIMCATPEDVINFLIWKDTLGDKRKVSCACPRRLAYTTVDTLIGKLRSIFNQLGRNYNEATLPGYGNPAADISVKKYLAAARRSSYRQERFPLKRNLFFLPPTLPVLFIVLSLRLCSSGAISHN